MAHNSNVGVICLHSLVRAVACIACRVKHVLTADGSWHDKRIMRVIEAHKTACIARSREEGEPAFGKHWTNHPIDSPALSVSLR